MSDEETTRPGDHTDSPHGYWHYEIVVEADPRIDYNELTDNIFGSVDDICGSLAGPEPSECAFEHHEGSTHVKCTLWERGAPDVRHVEQ